MAEFELHRHPSHNPCTGTNESLTPLWLCNRQLGFSDLLPPEQTTSKVWHVALGISASKWQLAGRACHHLADYACWVTYKYAGSHSWPGPADDGCGNKPNQRWHIFLNYFYTLNPINQLFVSFQVSFTSHHHGKQSYSQ